jgi:undecaprenyl diphosphate synthase
MDTLSAVPSALAGGGALGHVGIIPDGNRRFADRARIGVQQGYLLAADKALEVLGWCCDAGVRHVSAFGVSQENIARRPRDELRWLHAALVYFCECVVRLPDTGLHLFGDATALAPGVPERDELIRLQRDAEPAGSLLVHVGVNYSCRAELEVMRRDGHVDGTPDRFLLSANVPAVDLVVRTGGHRRLSGFLPVQTAYAELWFTDTLWPELTRDEFRSALVWYARQERHFGE